MIFNLGKIDSSCRFKSSSTFGACIDRNEKGENSLFQ